MKDDIASLLHHPSRRTFLGTALAATGFAMAAGPAQAGAITTDSDGLDAGPVLIPARDRELPAYAARPKGNAPAPVVLVVQEIFGVHEYIRDICRRLAKQGYLAVAPELYVRQGDPSGITDIPTLMQTIVAKVPDEQVLADLDATAAWAMKSAGGDPARLAITGFCWGGRIVWLYAAHNPALKVGVAWYGRLMGDATVNTPRHPLDVAAELKAPVLGLYGGADQGISLDSVEKMRAALKAAKAPSEIIVYDGAPHAFHADYRPSYREQPAKEGWARMLAWFKANGV
ncbi:MAG TPA: dienelactone hydrolase family protein [Magnetospirillum sp.]|jgi:carboxymethylenebutenolidase|nr:dienelactone hydrolase family protein [Magnetospirillum sp.]